MPSSFYTVQANDPVEEEIGVSASVAVAEDVLEDAPVQHGRLNELNARGRTLKNTLHPLLLQGQAWISEKQVNTRTPFSLVGGSAAILPEELMLYSFEMPRQHLSPPRVKFMKECSIVFEELQQAHAQYAVPGYLNRFSKLYESHFEALCTTLDSELLDNNPDNSGEIEDELASISSAMNLIHLTQAIYFQPNPSAIMAEDLMHWVNRLDSKPDPAEGDEIMRKQLACHHPAYWPFLFKAASRALFKVAISCLKSGGLVEYSGVDRTLLENIIHLLNTAPLGKQSQLARKANELWDLKNAWRQWHSNLEKLQIASIRNESARNGLGILLKILRGDREAIAEVSESWQEYVASMAFFSNPFMLNSYKEVQQLYDDAMEYGFNIDNTLSSEIAASALFTGDLPRALVHFFKTDKALAAHLSDLLQKSGALDQFDDGESITLRDQFVLDYGDLAINHPALSFTAFIYWRSVPQGLWRIEEAIVRVPLESAEQAEKLIDLCIELDLSSQRAEISTSWAHTLETRNQVGSALQFYEKGQSFTDIERICWNHFERLLLTGGMDTGMDEEFLEMLRAPPQTPMAATLIAPVALLYNFYELRRGGDGGLAVQYLSKLFRLASLPREYIALLMAELLPIFMGRVPSDLFDKDNRTVTIGQKDLFEILAAVEDYVGDEGMYKRGSELVSKAMTMGSANEDGSHFRNWRNLISSDSSSQGILGLFRIEATKAIAQQYVTN